jgi:ABC-type taurine transport system ATPase subunit
MNIEENDLISEEPKVSDLDLDYKKGNFYFDFKGDKKDGFSLKQLDIKIKKGDLVMVIGQIGSGKTALVNSILGYMYSGENGLHRVRQNIAYCP